ncbi:nucleoside monophosphate kinase [Candidatus Saccharibacteria bacterium]|nr:nucleoside monophosphate kinase [Candidatus Saccharibacteria bacterium]
MELNEKITYIKNWLGTGSINIFGLPMSGKDTVGVRLAELIGGRFLSSGLIIRANEKETGKNYTGKGELAPTDIFYNLVLPYFNREDLKLFPLILSSVGRWSGEEDQILSATESSGHKTKAVILLQISENDVLERWEAANILGDRGDRDDDREKAIFEKRCNEFREKTLPVISHYRKLGLLIEINADQNRESVFQEAVDKIYNYALGHSENENV